MNWSTRIYLAITLIALAVVLLLIYRLPVAYLGAIGVVITAGLSSIVIGVLGLVLYGGLVGWQWFKRELYQTKANKYVHYQDGFGMLHLLNLENDTVENLSTFPGSHHNGRYEDPPPAAAAAWYALVGKVRAESPVNLLPSTTQQESSLDLLTIFTQPTQSYAIIAGQQVGKTFQARRIAQHWLSAGCKPIVIGPKWDRGEWDGCALFGGEYNLKQANRGMQIVKRIAEDRHANKELSHKQHPIQPVFFDDWTAIRAHLLEESEAFILDATTLYASVNIILYFIIHLDTANAWGVHKIGAELKNNFVKLLIYPGYDEAGLIDRSRNKGYLMRPGETIKNKKPIALFGGTGSQLLLPDLVIQPNDPQLIQPTTKQATVLSTWDSGEHDIPTIAGQVYGPGGRQEELVKNTLRKFRRL